MKNIFKVFLKISIIIGIIFIYLCIVFDDNFKDFKSNSFKSLRIFDGKKSTNEHKFNIFFVETNENKTKLTSKDSCAIESAALNNPDALVFYYSKNVVIDKNLLNRYKNIQTRKLIVEDIFKNTPFFSLWKKLVIGSYSLNHLSDALRLALIWKYGGIYLDTDIITIKSLRIILNFPGIGAYSESAANNAVIVYPKNHPFINQTMIEFTKNYNPNCFDCHGPRLITRVFNDYCKTNNLYYTNLLTKKKVYDKLTGSLNRNIENNLECNNMFVYPINYFYPIAWQKYGTLFKTDSKLDKEIFIDSFGVHFWNKMSKKDYTKSGDGSIYDYFSSKNCPSIKNINFMK